MATIDKKQTRWYAESTFDALDKTTIPVGTEIHVDGKLTEDDPNLTGEPFFTNTTFPFLVLQAEIQPKFSRSN